MLKLFSKSPFVFLQHVISVHIKKQGLDMALAWERSTGGTGAGLVPNPCRSPCAKMISGTFLERRCPPASCLQGHPGDMLSQARGWPCQMCHPAQRGHGPGPAHHRAAGTQHLSTLCLIWYFKSSKTTQETQHVFGWYFTEDSLCITEA